MNFTEEQYSAAAVYIKSKTRIVPKLGLILGSGLGGIANEMEDQVVIPYEDIPNFPVSSAPSHKGCLVIGKLMGHSVVAMQGRVHMYEGYSPQEATFPIRVLKLLGIARLVITNAAGGINDDYSVGDLLLVRDHINLPGMAGSDPLRGPNLESFGPRFTDISHAYDASMSVIAESCARENNIPLHKGVYAFLCGPSFESPAEIRMLSLLGADAVGMSTVPEVIVANHCGVEVLTIAAITNVTIREIDGDKETSEEEVWESLDIIIPRMTTLIRSVLTKLSIA